MRPIVGMGGEVDPDADPVRWLLYSKSLVLQTHPATLALLRVRHPRDAETECRMSSSVRVRWECSKPQGLHVQHGKVWGWGEAGPLERKRCLQAKAEPNTKSVTSERASHWLCLYSIWRDRFISVRHTPRQPILPRTPASPPLPLPLTLTKFTCNTCFGPRCRIRGWTALQARGLSHLRCHGGMCKRC